MHLSIRNKGEIILEKLSIDEFNTILESRNKTASLAVALMGSLFGEKLL
jgi:hypothetical protein